ncbi:flippase [Anaerostipes hadrus]|uniref:flippase n=1 Tax=Anaerostipes hadrus TaxID=649756 RepID=UPI0022E906C2|nr:flippase [Anaerostipes hadrus]
MKFKSMKFNLIINVCNVVLYKIFPLITFPYITRILLEEGVGKYNFTISCISYFQLIAALGIVTYAIREGSKIRDNKQKFEVFARQIFEINLMTMIIAYLIFMLFLIVNPLKQYTLMLIIYSAVLFFDTIGVSWIYSIYEDFVYITIRNFIFQIISLVGLFVFVKDEQDVVKYIIITVISAGGSNILNFIHSRKYVKLLKFTPIYNITETLKPILIIFFAQIASTIYLNMDTIMLGFMANDASIGLYSAATKINTVITTLITAINAVVLPRLSYYVQSNEKKKFDELVKKVMKYYLFLTLPCIVGLLPITEQILTIFCGYRFVNASIAMKIMLIDLFFSLLNGFIAYQICIPYGNENEVLKSTILGAVTNTILNFILIPQYAQNGAAMATVLSEFTVFLSLIYFTKDVVKYKEIFDDLWQLLIATLAFIGIYFIIGIRIKNIFISVCVVILLGGLLYLILLYKMNNYIIRCVETEAKRVVKRLR